MKKYLYSLLIAVTAISLSSCDGKQTEPHIQWYPVITLEGESSYNVTVGDTWTDPGFTAVNTLTGEDATADVEVRILDLINNKYVSAIDFDFPGMYRIYYNSWGSEVTTVPTVYKTRTIYVFDPEVADNIGGTWMVNVDESYRIRYAGTNAGQELTFAEVAEANDNDISDGIPVIIDQILPGFLDVDDVLAGLVSQVYGYGAAYPSLNFQMQAILTMDAENVISLASSSFGYSYWAEDFAVSDFEGSYDPDTDTIHYTVDLPNQGFYLDVLLERY